MKNKTIYIFTIVVSLFILIPVTVCDNAFTSILSGIGCSGIAAGLMAIFLESAEEKRNEQRVRKARNIYFKELNDQISMMLGRILWLSEMLDDDSFNWSLDSAEYSSLKFMIYSEQVRKSEEISFDEASKRLNVIGQEYNLENMKNISEAKRQRVQKMFEIVAESGSYLLQEIRTIKENQLILATEDYMSIDENKNTLFEISLALEIMAQKDKNYSAAITALLTAANKVRRIGGYRNNIKIALTGSIDISEI